MPWRFRGTTQHLWLVEKIGVTLVQEKIAVTVIHGRKISKPQMLSLQLADIYRPGCINRQVAQRPAAAGARCNTAVFQD